MTGVALDIESGHLGIGELDALRISPGVKLGVELQTGLGRCGGYQFDHRQTAGQRPAPPILSDVAEQSVLDLIPFRSPWRVMVDLKRETAFVPQFLGFDLEQPHA